MTAGETWLYRVCRNWHSAAMACCQHAIQWGHLKGFLAADGLDGRKPAPTPLLGSGRLAWKRGKRRTPRGSVREDEMATQTVGSTRACVRLASTLECLGKRSVALPSYPSPSANTLLPCFEHMVHQRRHLATLTPGSCASSSPVGSLGTATSSTTCGSSRVKEGERWIILQLQLQTWLSSKGLTVNIWLPEPPT